MRKRINLSKLSRSTTARRALFRSQVYSLAKHGKIETTFAKAKVLKRQVDKLMGDIKDGQSGYRRVLAKLGNDKDSANVLIKIKTQADRVSGFTRITPLPPRRGDNAKRAYIELIDFSKEEPKKKEPKKTTKKTK